MTPNRRFRSRFAVPLYVRDSPKDFDAWLAGQDERLSSEAERLYKERRAKGRQRAKVKAPG